MTLQPSKTNEAGWRGWINPELTYAQVGERTMQVMPVSEHEDEMQALWSARVADNAYARADLDRLREAATTVLADADFIADGTVPLSALEALRAALAPADPSGLGSLANDPTVPNKTWCCCRRTVAYQPPYSDSMIQRFVDRFMVAEPTIRAKLAEKQWDEYKDLVRLVVETVRDPDKYGDIDPERIHEIDEGSCQGTLVYIIAGSDYQPDDYWFVKVGYGSCSGCDTLQAIGDYRDDAPTAEQVNDYWTLCLHVVQELRELGGEAVSG